MKQRYDSYKPSGIDWIGEIPSHWTKCRFKNFLRLHTVPSYSEVKIGLENIESKSSKYIQSDTEFDGNGVDFKKGFIVYGKLRPYLQKVWLAEFDGNAVGDFFIFKAKNNAYNIFIKYLLLSDGFTKEADGSTVGAKMPRVSSDFILNMPFYLPPLSEQEAIAAWLDEKCGEIDAAIAKVDREIELIDELKQSEISRVVTRGLNPNVPLRPSGIDWIGEIPSHWVIRKTSQLFHGIGSGTTPTSGNSKYYSEDGVNWLQTGDLNDGVINFTTKKITELALKDFSSLKMYPKGSLVIAMYGATIGKLGKLNITTTTNQACCVLPFSKDVEQSYAFYVYFAGKQALINSAYGGGQPNISQDTIRSFKIALPPLAEQREIASYLDKKCAEIDGLKLKLKKKRDTLVELRQSMISEVVTGKRKVV